MGDLIEIRRRIMMLPQQKTIGGIPVLIDNAYLPNRNGTIADLVADNRFFITGFFDTGSTSSKSYTYWQLHKPDDMSSHWAMRFFNDIEQRSVDYWGVSTAQSAFARTISSAGQFIAFSILKSEAANVYMFDNTNNRYLFKGLNVT